MVQSADIFVRASEGVWDKTPDGNLRRILCYTDELMMVEFAFEKGGEGWMHSHPHVQSSYVAEGLFEVIDAGDVDFSLPQVNGRWHGCVG